MEKEKERVEKDKTENLHPSWVARKKMKSQQGAKFQGKRIKF